MGFFDKMLNSIDKVSEIKKTIDTITYNPNIICTDGSSIRKDCIFSRYNLDDMKKIQNNFYILGSSNISLAIDEILYVNAFLAEAADLLSYFPKKQISRKNLCFKERLVNGTKAFCSVSFKSLTNTGKAPKYPMILHFYNSEELFGELSYAQNGEIEKGDIIVWNKGTCYEVQLRMIDDKLRLHTIYQTNPTNYKKRKIYYQ